MAVAKSSRRKREEEVTKFVDRPGRTRKRALPWQRWIDAELGFRNYWYPAALSRQLTEGGCRPVTLLGEELLLVRNGGRLYAIEDRCAHRGVRFSKRPLFYTPHTITCWYHTFTYNLDDGKLRCVLNEPGCPLAGKLGVRTYPIEERKGLVFVFVGDIDPPPLKCDTPPGFLDDDLAIHCAEPFEVKANWRLACENGFDPGHHFIHNWSPMVVGTDYPITMGYVSKPERRREAMEFSLDEPGPKGFERKSESWEMIFDSTIPARGAEPAVKVTVPGAQGKTPEQLQAMVSAAVATSVGLWLPCGLRVAGFPTPDITHYEWYVPKDENTHLYFQCGARRAESEEARERWISQEGHAAWEIPAVQGFTTEDRFAREGLQTFYGHEDGWHREHLYGPDVEIVLWRKFASEQARGVQPRNGARSGAP